MNPITISFIILSILYFAAGIYFFGFHWNETALWFRIVLPALFIANVLTAFFTAKSPVVTQPCKNASLETEKAFQNAQLRYFCEFLTMHRNGKRCVVIHAPGYSTDSLATLRSLLKDKISIVGVLELPMPAAPQPEAPPIGLPKKTTTAPVLDNLLATIGDFDIAIICTPLPTDCISEDGIPQITRLNNKELALAAGYRPSFAKAVEHGTILAALTYKDDAKCNEKTCPDDLYEAFEARYMLLSSLPLPTPPAPSLYAVPKLPQP
ncbi:MAG: hypothetical protein J6X55_10920 [Victivallales bacterium]|nr:hypothetical protein [Victivallales bacterium]